MNYGSFRYISIYAFGNLFVHVSIYPPISVHINACLVDAHWVITWNTTSSLAILGSIRWIQELLDAETGLNYRICWMLDCQQFCSHFLGRTGTLGTINDFLPRLVSTWFATLEPSEFFRVPFSMIMILMVSNHAQKRVFKLYFHQKGRVGTTVQLSQGRRSNS